MPSDFLHHCGATQAEVERLRVDHAAEKARADALEADLLQATMNAKKAEREHADRLAVLEREADEAAIRADKNSTEAYDRGRCDGETAAKREHAAALAAKDARIAELEGEREALRESLSQCGNAIQRAE